MAKRTERGQLLFELRRRREVTGRQQLDLFQSRSEQETLWEKADKLNERTAKAMADRKRPIRPKRKQAGLLDPPADD